MNKNISASTNQLSEDLMYLMNSSLFFSVSLIASHFPASSGCENPKPCQTELTVLQYGVYDGDAVTKVLLQPLTGN